MKNVIIMSQGNEITGINKYAINTYKAAEESAELYFVKFRKVQGNYGIGKAVEGRFPYGNSIFNLNSLVPKLAYSKFIEYIEKKKKDGSLIHVASPHVLKIVPGTDNIVSIHDMTPFSPLGKKGIEYMVTRRLYKHYLKYKNILTDSEYVKKMITDMGAEGNVDRIYPYISDNFFPMTDKIRLRGKYGLPKDKTLILSVSSNIARKNLRLLPEMLSFLGNEYKLVRIGEGIGTSYNFNLKDEIEMNELYNACDIMVSPSLDEGFGYPVVEGLKAGLPLAVSDIPVHKEVLNKYGLYFDPRSGKEAAMAVKEALETYRNDYQYPADWLSRFSLDKFRKQMIDYYNSVEKNK